MKLNTPTEFVNYWKAQGKVIGKTTQKFLKKNSGSLECIDFVPFSVKASNGSKIIGLEINQEASLQPERIAVNLTYGRNTVSYGSKFDRESEIPDYC